MLTDREIIDAELDRRAVQAEKDADARAKLREREEKYFASLGPEGRGTMLAFDAKDSGAHFNEGFNGEFRYQPASDLSGPPPETKPVDPLQMFRQPFIPRRRSSSLARIIRAFFRG